MATYWENSCSFGLRYVSSYKYLIVNLVFSHLGFWSGNLFLIAPFPDLCLLVPLYVQPQKIVRGLIFRIKKEEKLYCLWIEKKGADQLCNYCAADQCLCNRCLSDSVAHFRSHNILSEIVILW